MITLTEFSKRINEKERVAFSKWLVAQRAVVEKFASSQVTMQLEKFKFFYNTFTASNPLNDYHK